MQVYDITRGVRAYASDLEKIYWKSNSSDHIINNETYFSELAVFFVKEIDTNFLGWAKITEKNEIVLILEITKIYYGHGNLISSKN